ncbi:MAG: cytoplasmic protein [Acidobacteriota bacterium]
MPNDILDAHRHSMHHRDALRDSEVCGCFCCLDTFDYRNIEHWADGGDTALCPSCGVDSVLGSASGFPAGDRLFLEAMKRHWFSGLSGD